LLIFDWSELPIELFFTISNQQAKIKNLQLHRALLIRFARTCAERTALIALAQLTASSATLQRTLIWTQTSSSVYWKHTFNFSMGPRDHVHTDQFTNSARCCRSRISRCFNCTDVAAHKNRHVPCSDVLFAKQLYVRGLDHRVRGFNCAYESFGLDHSECF
jgi:hypothetical protein